MPNSTTNSLIKSSGHEIQLGGNVRQYSLFSNGTIFNEDPEKGENFKRIKINEGGGYIQIAKTFAEALKVTFSGRYDKNENFNGQFTPRVSAVYTFLKTIIFVPPSRPALEIRIHSPNSFTFHLPVESCLEVQKRMLSLMEFTTEGHGLRSPIMPLLHPTPILL